MKNANDDETAQTVAKYFACREMAKALGLHLELEGPGGQVRRFVVCGRGRRVPLADLEVLAGYLSGYRDSRADSDRGGPGDAIASG